MSDPLFRKLYGTLQVDEISAKFLWDCWASVRVGMAMSE